MVLSRRTAKFIALILLVALWSFGFTTGGPYNWLPPGATGQPLCYYPQNNAHQNGIGPCNTVLPTYTGTATPTATPTSGSTPTPTPTATATPTPTNTPAATPTP